MPARGVAFASHCVRSFLDVCRLHGLSSFVLFVDLSKAYDFAIRELLLGWFHHDSASNFDYLRSLGIPEITANAILDFIDKQGLLFEQLEVDAKVWELVHSLHQASWF